MAERSLLPSEWHTGPTMVPDSVFPRAPMRPAELRRRRHLRSMAKRKAWPDTTGNGIFPADAPTNSWPQTVSVNRHPRKPCKPLWPKIDAHSRSREDIKVLVPVQVSAPSSSDNVGGRQPNRIPERARGAKNKRPVVSRRAMRKMTLPNFLIIGAQKAGTTFLGRQLEQHPEIFCYPNEIHYFDKVYNYARGLDWYETHFEGSSQFKAIGEKTPDYLWANGQGVEGHMAEVHLNIKSSLPAAKLIVVLRNPVQRAVSAAWHIIRSGRVSPFVRFDQLLTDGNTGPLAGHGVIEYGHYAEQLTAYLELFSPDEILVLVFEEDIAARPTDGLKKVCNFLGVDPNHDFSGLADKVNIGRSSLPGLALTYYCPQLKRVGKHLNRMLPAHRPKVSAATTKALYQHYAPHNEQLFALLNRRIPSWDPS